MYIGQKGGHNIEQLEIYILNILYIYIVKNKGVVWKEIFHNVERLEIYILSIYYIYIAKKECIVERSFLYHEINMQ